MTALLEPAEPLHRLVEAALDETLDGEGWNSLDAILRDSGKAREYYLNRAKLHVALAWEVNAPDMAPPMSPAADEAIEPLSLESRWRDLLEGAGDLARNNLALSLLVAGLFTTILVLSMALIMVDLRPATPADGPPVAMIVAEITGTRQATWSAASDGHFKSTAMLSRDRLLLESGLAEVTFGNGAVVLLEGPAELLIDSSNVGTLRHGKLAAKVPPAAVGFVVQTPTATVIDLGTEFGVEALHADVSRVVVYEGKVNIESRPAPGKAPQQAMLTAGEIATVSRAAGVQKHGDAFQDRPSIVRRLPTDAKGQPQLVGLWRFDDAERIVHDSVRRLGPLEVVGEAHFEQAGRHGGALALDGAGAMLAARGSLDALPTGQSPYTVAAWIKPIETGPRGILGWGSYGTAGRTNALRIDGNNGFSHYWWGSEFGNDLIVSEKTVREAGVELAKGDWTHVAASWDGKVRRFYLNGRLISQDEPPMPLIAAEQFTIGRTAPEAREFFAGWLDDVAVFRMALSDEAIQSIMRGDFAAFGVSTP